MNGLVPLEQEPLCTIKPKGPERHHVFRVAFSADHFQFAFLHLAATDVRFDIRNFHRYR
jgi:hypothetical protein